MEDERDRWEHLLADSMRAVWRTELHTVREAVYATALTDAGWALLTRWRKVAEGPF